MEATIEEMKKNMPDLSQATIGNELPVAETETPLSCQIKDVETYQNSEMSNEVYHGSVMGFYGTVIRELLSSSKLTCRTGRHLEDYMSKTNEPTKALITGTAIHSLFLEPESFEYKLFDDSEICRSARTAKGEIPANPRSTKNYKEWMKTCGFFDEAGNRLPNVLDREDFLVMNRLRKKLKSHPAVSNLYKKAQAERSYFVAYENGLNLKIRPDLMKTADSKDAENFERVNEGDVIVMSFKTTSIPYGAAPGDFERHAFRNGYHIKEAFYHDVLRAVHNVPVHIVMLIVEVTTGLFMLRTLTPDLIEAGRQQYVQSIPVYMDYMKNRVPTGYETLPEVPESLILDWDVY